MYLNSGRIEECVAGFIIMWFFFFFFNNISEELWFSKGFFVHGDNGSLTTYFLVGCIRK